MARCKVCGEKFVVRYFNQKACTTACRTIYNQENPAKRLKNVSEKRQQQNDDYSTARKVFLLKPENKYCPVTGGLTTEIHHKNGRENERLLDQEFWVAVSRDGHTWIHENPEEAREKGWLI